MMRLPAVALLVFLLLTLSGCHLPTGPTSKAAAGGKSPAISETSSAKNIAAYVAYFERRGYKVTTNEQAYRLDGTVKIFHFAATRRRGTESGSVRASINAAAHTVSTSERSSSTTSSFTLEW